MTIEPKEGGAGRQTHAPSNTPTNVKSIIEGTRNKNVPVISYDVFQALDPYHKALAQVLQRYGDIAIEGVTA